ncbi:hypothetical protein EWB00_004604, partial [Schistosoma japonicum]
GLYTLLPRYRNMKHAINKKTAAKLSKKRILQSNMKCVKSVEVAYYRLNDLRPFTAIMLMEMGKSMVGILYPDDFSIHNHHLNQKHFQDSAESVPISNVNSQTLLKNSSTSSKQSFTHTINLTKNSIVCKVEVLMRFQNKEYLHLSS